MLGHFNHRAAATIDDDVGVFRKAGDGLLEQGDTFGFRARPGFQGVDDVPVSIEHRKRDAQNGRRLGGLDGLDQRRRIHEIGLRPGTGGVLTKANHREE